MRTYARRLAPLTCVLVLIACSSDSSDGPGGDSPDAGSPDGSGGGGLQPGGHFFGPVGSALGLSIEGETVTPSVTAATAPAVGYGSARFDFERALSAGASYTVEAGAAPANQTCRVYAGQTGTAPIGAGALRAGCEWTFDLISRSTDDTITSGADYSSRPAVGGASIPIGSTPALGDGRFVAFRSSMVGLAGNTTSEVNVFWRDRLTGQTRLVSKGPDGNEGNGRSEQPAISADGLTVAFRSAATNLVAGDTNASTDVFVWKIDLATGAESLVRASVGAAGEEANHNSETPTLSGDGNILAFVTYATNIAPGVNDSTLTGKVIRRDMAAATNTVVTRRPNGDTAQGGHPMISEDGNRIVYQAYANVIGDLAPNIWDMFVYEHSTDKNWPVTLAPSGEVKNQGSDSVSGVLVPAISGDGKWVAYTTTATNLAPGFDDGKYHVYLVEVDNCTSSGCNVKPVDLTTTGAPSDDNIRSDHAVLSYDGRWVVFTSSAPNLGGKNGVTNVFMHDRTSSSTARVTDIESTYSADAFSAISRDGGYVTFGCQSELDPRFPETTGYGGLYSLFTGHGAAFTWPTGPLAQE